jgi:hypothetical protein
VGWGGRARESGVGRRPPQTELGNFSHPARAARGVYFKRGSVPPRCILGSAILVQFFLRNGSN